MIAVSPIPWEKRSQFPLIHQRHAMAQTYYLDSPDLTMFKNPLHHYSQRDCPSPINSSAPSSIPPSPHFAPTTEDQLPPTPATLSSLSLSVSNDSDDEIILPSYDLNHYNDLDEPVSAVASDQASESLLTEPPCLHVHTPAADDTSVEEEPSRHVDYLSHEWKEEDIWASWKYVVCRRDVYSNGARLENASWRTWAKLKNNLGTVSPETLNWLKDCDVTWLYGPLKSCNKFTKASPSISPPPSCLATPSFYADRKPILKKRTASETILQRSLSQHTLLQHAGAILKAQEAGSYRTRPCASRPELDPRLNASSANLPYVSLSYASTKQSSGVASPSGRRRIHFNNEVVQCIAIDAKGADDDEEEEGKEWPVASEDDVSSDDGIVMMGQFPPQESGSHKSTPRGSFSSENKIIAPLPPTTLKCRGDTPEPPSSSMIGRWTGYFSKSTVASTSSVPSDPAFSFFLDGEEDHLDFCWQPSQSQGVKDENRPWFVNPEDEEEVDQRRLSNSSMSKFSDEGDSSNIGIFDRVVDTVNTARDIAHVIWNVGWRR
ncbi:hypothetical protein CNMCM5793_007966 [Aspergillus hiratsukae]|uniref:Nitrogen regulatory protein areA GATA-like domain-containing protein n=1 Tax=Aspergillus hiratsukae TaxID=1194566 RepID=A0A8H6P7N3_9EURO|nr:hypothetical protein CNMCM5793_007966 [Aspergillus hiratsukae]KAF7158486.1 hypothetical protein CNMCM6106_005080 [Aspergillus hiratsukae]